MSFLEKMKRGCLKSTPSLGLLFDNFYHLGDSQSISLPFETASKKYNAAGTVDAEKIEELKEILKLSPSSINSLP